ncbi:MAG TPA: FAD-dependent oxidoreductase [Steroidobacteraceae bacterium]|nr:FAD-dependent oxidoreductase [Steroidobacteraceae bacterium]
MDRQNAVAVIGAGVIGAALAARLAAEGTQVLLLDRADPGTGGASFGNAGHIASEHVEPLPSRALLRSFWRDLYPLGGVLDIPFRRTLAILPWARRFAAAAARQAENTLHLAPLVSAAVEDWERLLGSVGRSELLHKGGHYEVWFGRTAHTRAAARAQAMERGGVATQPAPPEWLRMSVNSLHRAGARAPLDAAALWFPLTAHVLDPLEVVQALVSHAVQAGAELARIEVRAVQPNASGVGLHTAAGILNVRAAIVCAGAWSAPLLEPLGLSAPLEPVRGYHVELPDHAPVCDATIVYSDDHVVVTPMRGRLRATSFMDFAGLDAPLDARKPARLHASLARLGYRCDRLTAAWAGPRPVLPDYLPGIGRLERSSVFYAIGHQHIGLTLAAGTAELVAALVAGRTPRQDVSAFDLRRFAVR